MNRSAFLLAAGLLLMALPAARATHNVCDNDPTDVSDPFGVAGVDDPFTGLDGIYVCLGTQAVGVDPDVYAGPEYGATVRVLTCSDLGCDTTGNEDSSNTGVVIDDTGTPRICIDNAGCP